MTTIANNQGQKVTFPQCAFLPKNVGDLVQTRSETTGLIQHVDLGSAIALATKDKTIWKISYTTEDGHRRFVIR